MLDTKKFVEKLIEKGYSHICAVPCSFAKYLINEVINNNKAEYIACSSEAVACSIASGLKVAGKKPIVIMQSSGLTNAGSNITSLLNPYNITFPIITSWRTYKNGDSEIQHKHLAINLPNLIKAYGYEYVILDQHNLQNSLSQIELCNNTKTIAILKKDTFSKIELENKHKLDLSKYPKRGKYLKYLNDKFKDSEVVFIGTTGNTSREMYSFMSKTNNFYMVGNMGGALSLGLGIAKTGKKVIVLGGDAEFSMHMGGVATAGRYKDIHLIYIVFDNEQNKSTGGQNSYQNHINYIDVAKGCGFSVVDRIITSVKDFEKNIKIDGLNFMHVKCDVDEVTPRPPIEVVVKNMV